MEPETPGPLLSKGALAAAKPRNTRVELNSTAALDCEEERALISLSSEDIPGRVKPAVVPNAGAAAQAREPKVRSRTVVVVVVAAAAVDVSTAVAVAVAAAEGAACLKLGDRAARMTCDAVRMCILLQSLQAAKQPHAAQHAPPSAPRGPFLNQQNSNKPYN